MRTRVGYAGGRKARPTYRDLGDHTETIEIDYDPEEISFEDLLTVFWQEHDPHRGPISRQYMAAVFFHDAAQKRLAEETRVRIAEESGRKVTTKILPATPFHLAEDYHQKYMLRQVRTVARAYTALYPELSAFVGSTAVTRLNGYLGGHGSVKRLREDAKRLGLSTQALRLLENRLRR